MRVGSLFSGIGGFDLGLERAGHEIVWQVENDAYCRKVLAKHWPDVPCYEDIHDCGAHNLEEVDVCIGGFPCQPVSVAGNQLAQDDERWLWPEFARVIRELRPRYALVENVPGLLVRGMGDVLGDLAVLGYDAEWGCVSAASVGAPHLRKRIFIVAHANGNEQWSRQRSQQSSGDTPGECISDCGDVAHSMFKGLEGRTQTLRQKKGWNSDSAHIREKTGSYGRDCWWDVEPNVGRVADGVPARVDRLRGLGNAIVPQVAEWIGRQIR
jgi:DNA (cytosine-5)-methyltransferase 1